MSLPSARQFKLASPRGDGRHPYVNADGAFIGRGVPLLERDPLGRWRPRDGATLARLLAIGYGASFELEWRAAQLRGVAAAPNEGDLVLAGISLVQMQLPALPCAGNARAMAIADGLLGKYNPDWGDEPRVPAGNPDGGQWTDGDGGDSQDASVTPAAARTDATQAKKERFVDAHLTDAQMGAARLRVPVENILGLSALESSWGEHHFAAEGNNFFGLHYPASYATGYRRAGRSAVRMATFASYADSLRSFEASSGSLVRGITDPREFAAALQNSGKFGVDPKGKKIPTYVGDVDRTIRGIRALLSRRQI